MGVATIVATRWLAVGSSDLPDSAEAGRAAAVAATGGRTPKLLIVFASHGHAPQALLDSIADATNNAPLIGCTTAGEIAVSGPSDSGVVIVALGGDGFNVRSASAVAAEGQLRDASAKVAACARGLEGEYKALLLLSDGLGGDQEEVVRGAYSVVGASIPLVGGCAGDDLKMIQTVQFHDRTVLHGAVVGAAISSDSPIGIGVRHGWRRVGEAMLVTSSSDNHVYALDDKPALDAYLEKLGVQGEARTDPAAFTQFAITHPLGISRRSGEQVRFVAGANFDDRSLSCIANVPQGGLAWFMEGDENSVLEATDAACTDAIAALGGRKPIGFVAFDCIARRGVLGKTGIVREVERIGSHAAGAPVAGFYTYGEIARTHGTSGFHNQTLVVLALS
jgi:hypothetical protein